MDDDRVIWARPERAGRGPEPAHSRAAIAGAAVRVGDAEGIDAVSMRRIATELGTGTTSLYRYVRGKDEIFELMVDAVMGSTDPPPRTGEWRADLRTIARAVRTLALKHPWLSRLNSARPTLGPANLRWIDAMYGSVDGHSLSADEVMAAVGTLLIFVHGYVTSELAEAESVQRTGLTNGQWMAAQGAYGDEIIHSGRYPHLARVMVEAELPHRDDRGEEAFARGLDHLLDGLAGIMTKS